jgi:hypothetical protein
LKEQSSTWISLIPGLLSESASTHGKLFGRFLAEPTQGSQLFSEAQAGREIVSC